MKTKTYKRALPYIILGLILACSTRAQGLPPSSIGNLDMDLTILGGNGLELAVSGAVTATFTPSGGFAFLDATGMVAPGQYGTYSYAVVNGTTASVVYRQANFPDETMTLTFTTALGGTYSAVAGSGTAFGVFALGANDTTGPLINLSTRVGVTSGQSVIAGFVVGGTIPRTVLVRAIGPTLSSFGVTDAIRATTMSVYSGSQVLATNAGWSSSTSNAQALTKAFAATGAFSLTNGSADR